MSNATATALTLQALPLFILVAFFVFVRRPLATGRARGVARFLTLALLMGGAFFAGHLSNLR